jgi:hypothetical protein
MSENAQDGDSLMPPEERLADENVPTDSTPRVLRMIDLKLSYTVQDRSDTVHTYLHSERFEAVQPMRFFRRWYQWSGTGQEHEPAALSQSDDGLYAHRVHGPLIREGAERVYLVYLGRELSRGERDLVTTQQKFIDEQGTFQPYLRHHMRAPLEKLELEVILPRELASNVRTEQIDLVSGRSLSAAVPLQDMGDLEGLCHYSYRVKTPRVGVRYGIKWLR